jgi:hypothetical protein
MYLPSFNEFTRLATGALEELCTRSSALVVSSIVSLRATW